ncbi:serine protease snake-like isoform X2 [Drosophila obscura]|nr:serine protease snake-like isoform X2 [Drosophila obscura]
MAHIGQKDETGFNYTWDCGGTVIHSKFVLTAAHCVIRERLVGTKEKDLVVRLGAHNTTDGDVYEVANKIPHPDYDEKTYANDIALLELTKTVVFNDQVRPACLTTSSGEEYDNMTVSGWGRYSRNKANDQAPELRKAELKLFKFSECPDVPQEMYICAGGDKNGSDSCDGDSGGPLARWHQEWGSCLGQVFAVVSRGSYCHTTSPRSKYTKVFYYLQWIENVVWPVTRENTD